jgi:hypothetical protein
VSVEGPGDLRLVLGGCEMVCSGEDAGWQVWFEGDTFGHDTDALVSQVAQQVQGSIRAGRWRLRRSRSRRSTWAPTAGRS